MSRGFKQGWMLYGASGFTGRLILAEALRRGHRPLLAGRDREALESIGRDNGLDHVAVSLEDTPRLQAVLAQVGGVLNAAGPFGPSARSLIDACLWARADYADISGEIHHLRHVLSLDAQASAAGVTILTGAGFGVTFGDCLAQHALQCVPDATELRLSVAAANAQTTGTVKRTMLSVVAQGGFEVRDGVLVPCRLARRRWRVSGGEDLGGFASAPMGELVAAARSTGVPNVQVGRPLSPVRALALCALSPMLKSGRVLQILRRGLDRQLASGPTPSATPPAEGWRSRVWAEVSHGCGGKRVFELETGEGYAATASAAVAAVEALSRQSLTGAFTPGSAFGARFLGDLPGVSVRER